MSRGCCAALSVLLLLTPVAALVPAPQGGPPPGGIAEDLLSTMGWREVGPFRGGRSAAVSGIPSQPNTYYFGAAGGGVWKTVDGGRRWENVSDGFFGGSIGAVAVAPSDPNVVYVGTGEKTVRGNVSHGDGMWRSLDAGKTWEHIGLKDSRHIPRVRVHPAQPNIVYAAVLGHLFGPNDERGVYRSTDYGKTWKRVHFVDPNVGCVDLALDPTNARRMFATFWRVRRTPHSLESGGEGSGIWRSTDGGDSWTELTSKSGLPKPPLGISGISVCASNPESVYAIVEAKDGGVFRSRDGGETWQRTNQERSLRQRAWYYSRIYADPIDAEVVYVLNVGFHRSKDGGKTFTRLSTPHGDNHDLWIDPTDSSRMIESNDGGANVSADGGQTWTRQDNQPTAQMYRVSTDTAFPYRLLGGQQDNSALRIRSRGLGRGIGLRDWEPTAGGESGHITAKPDDPDVVYGGSYGGYLTMFNHRTRERRNVHIWPDNPMGAGSGALRERFQWNFPLQFSRHDSNTLYAASQYLYRTRNGGAGWDRISPDLTRNDAARGESSGGPITKDNTGVEYYCTLFAVAESCTDPKVIWVGSDDGRVHVTRDAGENWADITPPSLPEWTMINSIDAHPFEPGGAYLAATRYKLDDFRPFLLVTTDWGRSWKTIVNGIPSDHFTRVIRADPDRRGLLYAGTERGIYVSANNGGQWQSLQLDLPIVPITDLSVCQGDLVAATQGRGFWILDDLSPLHRTDPTAGVPLAMWKPRPTLRIGGGGGGRGRGGQGANPLGGVPLRFRLAEPPEPKTKVRLVIRATDSGAIVRSIDGKVAKDPKPASWDPTSSQARSRRRGGSLTVRGGMNLYRFDLRYKAPERVPGMILWTGGRSTARCVPGRYTAELTIGDLSASTEFEVRADPRSTATPADLVAQRDFVLGVREQLDATHRCIRNLRSLRDDLKALGRRIDKTDRTKALRERIQSVRSRLDEIEQALYQTKNQSRQDPLNFPIRLNDKLSGVMSAAATGDFAPTASMIAVREQLVSAIRKWTDQFDRIVEKEVPMIERLARENAVPALRAPGSREDTTDDEKSGGSTGDRAGPEKDRKKPVIRSQQDDRNKAAATGQPLVQWSGVLLDPTGQPVAGARVAVGSLAFAIGAETAPWQSTRSDANGHFDLAVTEPVTGIAEPWEPYMVAEAEGRTRIAIRGGEVGQCGPSFRDSAFGGTRFLRLTLNREAVLEGRVLSREGAAVAGATVVLQALEDDGHHQVDGREATTDEQGRYRVGGLTGGSFRVVALGNRAHAAGSVRCRAGTTVTRDLRLDRPSHDLRFDLPGAVPGATRLSLLGPVLLPLSQRVPMVPSHSVTVPDLPAGDYVARRVDSNHPGPSRGIRFRSDAGVVTLATTTGQEPLPLRARLTTAGDQANPHAGFDGTSLWVEQPTGWVRAPLDRRGAFDWPNNGTSSRTARVWLRSQQWTLANADPDGTASVMATGKPFAIPIAPARVLLGSLEDPDGEPGVGWTVRAGLRATVSDVHGRFRLTMSEPLPRAFGLRVLDSDGSEVAKAELRGERVGARPMRIEVPRRARLSGQVLGSDHRPLAGVQVALYRGEGESMFEERTPITTNAEGRFCFTDLTAGPRILSLRSAAFLSVVRKSVVIGDQGDEVSVRFVANPAR